LPKDLDVIIRIATARKGGGGRKSDQKSGKTSSGVKRGSEPDWEKVVRVEGKVDPTQKGQESIRGRRGVNGRGKRGISEEEGRAPDGLRRGTKRLGPADALGGGGEKAVEGTRSSAEIEEGWNMQKRQRTLGEGPASKLSAWKTYRGVF